MDAALQRLLIGGLKSDETGLLGRRFPGERGRPSSN
jgi:hypothetical protein